MWRTSGSTSSSPWQKWRHRALALLWAAVCAVLLLSCWELLIRLGIHFDFGGLRKPIHYASPICGDDYHKLHFFWRNSNTLRPGQFVKDPVLGWLPDPEAGRLAGIRGPGPLPAVALFGDSFTAGVPPATPYERIPILLEDLIPEGHVVNFAVPGYGLDQIYLRFQQAVAEGRPAPAAVVGVILNDVDRVVERFRGGPKPYFVLEDGDLALRGVPIESSQEEWLAANPVSFRSYALAVVRRRLGRLSEDGGPLTSECRREEKETLSKKILENLVAESRRAEMDLLFILFYNRASLSTESWHERFLKSAFDALAVDYLDTRPILQAAAQGLEEGLDALYFPPPNGHLNARGNAVVAEATFEVLQKRLGWGHPRPNRLKENIRFGDRAGNAGSYEKSGWAKDSREFAWTRAERASFTVDLPPTAGDVVLYLETCQVLKTADDPRSLTIRAGETVIREKPVREFPDDWRFFVMEIAIPRDAIREGKLTLTFELPYLLTRREAGLDSDNPRRLGVAVRSMALRSAPPAGVSVLRSCRHRE
ncbi:MAG: SGNH/GDSL hydrolase family protein [bacterium]|nr:SGNH/GDSL hydrolase family protein [bacterium]